MKKLFYSILFLNLITASNIFAHGNEHGSHEAIVNQGFTIADIIAPLGITTLVLLLITFTMGLILSKYPKKRKKILPWHKRVAFLTVILALSHAVIVIFFH